MVFFEHELQSLVGVTVVERHGLVVGNVYRVGKAFLKLYESDDAIVDKSHKLGSYAVADQRLFLYLQRTYALSLDEKLVGER